MATAKSNCREQFTAADFDFIAKTLATTPDATPILQLLVTDADALNAALESDRLLQALLESPRNLVVSPPLYFYVLTRHMLRGFSRSVADYVARILVAAVGAGPRRAEDPAPAQFQYITDMLIALQSASTDRAFGIRVHVGDYSLFLSGVFPQHIHERAVRRGAPALSFYDAVGSSNYRLAAQHRLAEQGGLVEVYETMAERFTDVRVGLNQMADRLLCVEAPGGLPE